MKDFDVLKDIWHGQNEAPKIAYDDVFKRIRQTKNGFAGKLLFQVISLIAAIAILLFILYNGDFKLGTSQLGILIFILCLAYYLLIQVKDYLNISKSERMLEKPDEYINWLKTYKQHRYNLNTQVYKIYMIFIAIGISLNLIELFYKVSLWVTALIFISIIAWFLMCYFIFMKQYIKKEETRLNMMINNLERLQKQFDLH